MRLLLLSAVLAVCSPVASAQFTPCTLSAGEPVCDRVAFSRTLAAAKSVSFNDAALDRGTAKQLRDLLRSLGKQIIADSDHPGLSFVLLQPDLNGVFVGPSGVVLARLRVYAPGGRTLLWEETYTDQPDVPWPSAVLYLLQQFRDRFAKP